MGPSGIRLVLSDIDTHPDANKGAVAGTSIAMGNAPDDVKALATHVTTPNDADGFARAMHEVVLAS